MNFQNAVISQESHTLNNMKAHATTLNACVDFFFKAGASRGQDIIPTFVAAYVENKELALRIAQWLRDVRGGAGERQLYRDILLYLEVVDPSAVKKLLEKTPELGRWDDLLLNWKSREIENFAFGLVKKGLEEGNGLCAKWCPRKGETAVKLRNYLKMTPKQYRKTLVNLTKVVESQMCAQEWDKIEFEKVPSLAMTRYNKAFKRNCETHFSEYVEALKKGKAKVNTNAVYPYDILKKKNEAGVSRDLIISMWNALPDFTNGRNIFPVVDVSGSMYVPVGKNNNLSCIDVALSLGIYCADKNKGPFNGIVSTFSAKPQLVYLKGNVLEKFSQLKDEDWGMNTNLHAVFDLILEVAKKGEVSQEEMPEMILIFSDMQFDYCVRYDDSAIEMIRRKYEKAGYEVPKVVFWNIHAYDNVPVRFNENGVALVSGFSHHIVKSLLGDFENFTPENIMLQTVMVPRYEIAE